MKVNQPYPKSVLGLDIGKKRIGIAGCDPLGITITKLKPIHRRNFTEELNYLMLICKQRKVEALVIGIPLDSRGMKTNQALYCETYGHRIAKILKLPIAWVNEHSSTWIAAEERKLQNERTNSRLKNTSTTRDPRHQSRNTRAGIVSRASSADGATED